MYRLERLREAEDAGARYEATCCINSSGRLRIGADCGLSVCLSEVSSSSLSMLDLGVASSDSVEDVDDMREHELEVRWKMRMFTISFSSSFPLA